LGELRRGLLFELRFYFLNCVVFYVYHVKAETAQRKHRKGPNEVERAQRDVLTIESFIVGEFDTEFVGERGV
jgi:hypothetical protein